jgi:cyclophilin family peptidyl-prolyl cis-trans isomerase
VEPVRDIRSPPTKLRGGSSVSASPPTPPAPTRARADNVPAVPSEKRARQRALRAQKQAVIQKQRKRRTTLRRTGAFSVLALAIIAIVLVLQLSPSPKKKAASTTTTTSTTVPTTVPLSTAAVAPICPPATTTRRITWFTKAPPDCIGKTSVWDATFTTSLGNFVVQMDAAQSYLAVNNFVFLSKWNYYNGTYFHRVIPGFVVQGGDPTGTGSGGPHRFPGYSYTGNTPPASCKTKPAQASCYRIGDIAVANSGTSASDGSQFFVVLPGGPKTLNTEPLYTDFGKVTVGMNVVEKIGADGSSGGTPKVKVYLLKVTVKQVKA